MGVPLSLILFSFGATIATVGDMVHVLTGTTSYPPTTGWPHLFGLVPWWVPLEMGAAALSIGWGQAIADKIFRVKKTVTMRVALIGGAGFFGAYALSGLLVRYQTLDSLVLFALAFGLWWFLDRTFSGIFNAVGAAISGVLVEMTLIHFGVFSYSSELYLVNGVPPWLFFLYLSAGIAAGTFFRLKPDALPIASGGLKRKTHLIPAEKIRLSDLKTFKESRAGKSSSVHSQRITSSKNLEVTYAIHTSLDHYLVFLTQSEDEKRQSVFCADANGKILWWVPSGLKGKIWSLNEFTEGIYEGVTELGFTYDLDPQTGRPLKLISWHNERGFSELTQIDDAGRISIKGREIQIKGVETPLKFSENIINLAFIDSNRFVVVVDPVTKTKERPSNVFCYNFEGKRLWEVGGSLSKGHFWRLQPPGPEFDWLLVDLDSAWYSVNLDNGYVVKLVRLPQELKPKSYDEKLDEEIDDFED